MFNMLSADVAIKTAMFMGLSSHYASVLLLPIVAATGLWSLPLAAAPLPYCNNRGLPQGMSTSVLLSELAISPLLWRVARILPQVSVLAYVDDLNMIACSREELLRVIGLLWDFERDFKLELAIAKTKVWVTDRAQEDELRRNTGFETTSNLNALGGQWPIRQGTNPEYPKEVGRLDQCRARLERAKVLSINPARLAHIVSAGCLSLLDFVNHPDPRPYQRLRTLVKEAFGLKAAAPEAVVCLLQKGTLDPYMRWLLSGIRLWHHVLRESPEEHEVNEVIEQCKGRLGRCALESYRWGIRVTRWGFELSDRFLSLREEWFISRKVILAHLKQEQAKRLAMRRPTLYAGLTSWNHRQHSRLLNSLPPLRAMVLLKLWTGAIMCKHKRQQIYGESPQCACGHDSQTVGHLLWSCPLVPPPPVHLEYRRHLPPSQSVTHLLPQCADMQEVGLWKESCLRAIKIVASPIASAPLPQPEPPDLKGHSLGVSHDGAYSFCRKCFVTRRSRDRKWIWTKRCTREDSESRDLGEFWVEQGHEVTLRMAKWKLTAQRPRMVCARCRQEVWATAGWRQECQGEG